MARCLDPLQAKGENQLSALTPPTPAPTEPVFNGREFVGGGAPAGESPSPSDGNDDGGQLADDAAPSDSPEGGEGAGEELPAGEEAPPAEAGQEGKDLWEQTPEEKRRERFNHALEHSNALAKKLAKYEKGEGPKPAELKSEEPAAPAPGLEDLDQMARNTFFGALQAQDETKLTETQRSIRRLDAEVVALHTKTVVPAETAFAAATEALSKAETALRNKQIALAELKELSQGNEGMYQTEIDRTEAAIQRLEDGVTRAKSARTDARLDLKEATEKYELRQDANRNKAVALARQDARKHHETAAEKKYQADYKAEEDRLAKVWEDDLTAVFTEMKIPAKLHKAAARNAFLEVQELNEKRGAQNPVTEKEFRKLIKASLADLAGYAALDAGDAEAAEAAARAAATDQPAPKKRTATGSPAAKPMSKDEAFANVRAAMGAAAKRSVTA